MPLVEQVVAWAEVIGLEYSRVDRLLSEFSPDRLADLNTHTSMIRDSSFMKRSGTRKDAPADGEVGHNPTRGSNVNAVQAGKRRASMVVVGEARRLKVNRGIFHLVAWKTVSLAAFKRSWGLLMTKRASPLAKKFQSPAKNVTVSENELRDWATRGDIVFSTTLRVLLSRP